MSCTHEREALIEVDLIRVSVNNRQGYACQLASLFGRPPDLPSAAMTCEIRLYPVFLAPHLIF